MSAIEGFDLDYSTSLSDGVLENGFESNHCLYPILWEAESFELFPSIGISHQSLPN